MIHELTSISIYNFRNYKHLSLDLCVLSNILLYGVNGSGKTNFLEAISLFESQKGLRKANSSELQSTYSTFPWAIHLKFSGNLVLTVGIDNLKKKIFKINGKPTKFAEFGKYIWITWITPRLDLTLSDNQSEQRKFFDHLISGVINNHKEKINRYKALIKERQFVLKRYKNEKWLDKIEYDIAIYALAIHKNRATVIEMINHTLENQIRININGSFESRPEINVILETLKNNRIHDSQNNSTFFGPHKTNFEIYYSNKQINSNLCSTGEQKMILIDILCAAIKIHQEVNNTCTLLLLDDVFAHLDRVKIMYILERIESLNIQCFFTSVDDALKSFSNCEVFHIENGVMSKV